MWHLAAVRSAGVIAVLVALALVACGGSSDASERPGLERHVRGGHVDDEAECGGPGRPPRGCGYDHAAGTALQFSLRRARAVPSGSRGAHGRRVPITVFYPALDGDEEGQPGDVRPPGVAAAGGGGQGRRIRPSRCRHTQGCLRLTPTAAPTRSWCSATAWPATACSRRSSRRISHRGASWSPRSSIPIGTSPRSSVTSARSSPASVHPIPPMSGSSSERSTIVQAATASTGPLAGLTVETTRVGAVGHSAGGFAVYGAAAADPRIATYVALASPVGGSFTASTPTTAPAVPRPTSRPCSSQGAPTSSPHWPASRPRMPDPAPAEGLRRDRRRDPPRLHGHLHAHPARPTERARGREGRRGRDSRSDRRLFADGCDPKYTAANTVWPVIDALTTAQLRAALGLDDQLVGFTQTDLEGVSRPRDHPLEVAMTELPARGRSRDEVLDELDAMRVRATSIGGRAERSRWRTTPVHDVLALPTDAFVRFMDDNGLNPDAFPSSRHLQADVVAMVADDCSTASRCRRLHDHGRHREHPDGGQGRARARPARARHHATRDGAADDRARRVREGRALLRRDARCACRCGDDYRADPGRDGGARSTPTPCWWSARRRSTRRA